MMKRVNTFLWNQKRQMSGLFILNLGKNKTKLRYVIIHSS